MLLLSENVHCSRLQCTMTAMLVSARVQHPHVATLVSTNRVSHATKRPVVWRLQATVDDASSPTEVPSSEKSKRVQLACPVCFTPFVGTLKACVSCARSFPTSNGVIDLCLDAGGANGAYKEPPAKSGTKLFQNEAISSIYENGWRQSFSWAGFPGEEKETQIAMRYMDSAFGGVLLDVSCGSGLFSRQFAKSEKFQCVVASDFSQTMMNQTREYCGKDEILKGMMEGGVKGDLTGDSEDPSPSLLLLKADVGRLPFKSGSLDAVHAGAAMHCWPSPSLAVAEISRVLKPGGVFCASTFLDPTAMFENDEAMDTLSSLFKDSGAGTGGAFNQFFSEPELRDLTTKMCGFQGWECERERQFIFFKVVKPME